MGLNEQNVRVGGDLLGLVSWGAWFVGALPAIGLTLTAIWTFMRIVEMVTGRPFHKTQTAMVIRCAFSKVFGWIPRVFWPKRGDKTDD